MAGRAATRRPTSGSSEGEEELGMLSISSDDEPAAFVDSTNNHQVLLRPCWLEQRVAVVQLCGGYARATYC